MPKIVDHDQRRREILNGCFDLFATHGYAALSMRKMATKLGVTTGVLYHYFDGKQAIFEQIFASRSATDVAMATADIKAGTDPHQRLSILRSFLSNYGDELMKTLQVALDHQRQDASSNILATTMRFYRQSLGEILGITDHDDQQVIVSVILGWLVQRILEGEPLDVGAHVNGIERLIMTTKQN